MNVDISALESASEFWEFWGYVTTGLVLLGVVGEFITELTHWIKDRPLRKLIEKLSVLVLIIGIAGEIVCQVQANGKNSLIAGALNERAEQLKSDNLAIQKILAPRRLFFAIPKDKFSLITALDQFKGTPVWLQVVPDFEAKVLANDIFAILHDHFGNVRVVNSPETNLEPQSIWDGVSIHSFKPPSKSAAAGKAVSDWLTGTEVNPTGAPQFFDLSPWDGKPGYLKLNAPSNVVLVTVGMKPVAAMLGHSSATISVVNPNNPIK